MLKIRYCNIFFITAPAVNNDIPAPVYPVGTSFRMSKRGSTRGSVRFNKGAPDMSNTPRSSFYGPNVPPPRGSIYGASNRDPMYNFNKMSMRGHGSMRGPGSQRNRGSFRCDYIYVCTNAFSIISLQWDLRYKNLSLTQILSIKTNMNIKVHFCFALLFTVFKEVF